MPFFMNDTTKVGETCRTYFEPELQIPEQTRPLVLGEVLTPEQKDALPRLMRVGKLPRKGLPDIFGWGGGGQWVFCQKLKGKIEELEPDVHEFLPVALRSTDDVTDYGTYFHLLYTVKLDAFVYDKTEFTNGRGYEAAKRSKFRIYPNTKMPITLRENVIAGHHLWRGARERSMLHTYCSDELGEFIKSEKLTGADLSKISTE